MAHLTAVSLSRVGAGYPGPESRSRHSGSLGQGQPHHINQPCDGGEGLWVRWYQWTWRLKSTI